MHFPIIIGHYFPNAGNPYPSARRGYRKPILEFHLPPACIFTPNHDFIAFLDDRKPYFLLYSFRTDASVDGVLHNICKNCNHIDIPNRYFLRRLYVHRYPDLFLFRIPPINGQNAVNGFIGANALRPSSFYIIFVLPYISEKFFVFPVLNVFFDQKAMMADIVADSHRFFSRFPHLF